jgi:hypothetical protein
MILPPGVSPKSMVDGTSNPDWIFSGRDLVGTPFEELEARAEAEFRRLGASGMEGRASYDEEENAMAIDDDDDDAVMWDTGESIVRVYPKR